MQRFALIGCLVLLGMLVGCGGKFTREEFVRGDVDFEVVSRVAVLPFLNHTSDKFIHERVRNVAITQLLANGVADVVDRGIVDSVLYEEVIDPFQPIDLINLKRLGQRLNVQAFLLGSVDMVAKKQSGAFAYPQLALTLRLVEGQSASILWQSSGHWTSESFVGKMFGIAPTDSYHINIELLNRMMKSLAER
ncbi:MAG: hypothetical protein ABFS18_06350 [Thermodesulfobacteriota bacterium]